MKNLLVILTLIFAFLRSEAADKGGIRPFQTGSDVINDICFSAGGMALAVPDGRSIKIFSVDSGALIRELRGGHHNEILSVDLSRDSTILVSAGKDSTAIVWDLKTGEIISVLRLHRGIITCIKLSPDGNLLASGGTDHKVVIYDLRGKKVTGEFTDHSNDITCLAFSNDGTLLAAGGGDRKISVYDSREPSLIATLTGHTDWVRGLAFNESGTRLVSCDDDAMILKWDVSDQKAIRDLSSLRNGQSWLLSISSWQDDRIFGVSDLDGGVRIIWTGGTYSAHLKVPVTKIAFRPSVSSDIQIAVATRGKGCLFMTGSAFKLNEKKKVSYFPFLD